MATGTDDEYTCFRKVEQMSVPQLLRELQNIEKILNVRINGIEKIAELLRDDVVRMPTDREKQIAHLQQLINEKLESIKIKFESIDRQFCERDERADAQVSSARLTLEAALKYQKEAQLESNKNFILSINKSEENTQAQLEQLRTVLTSVEKTLSEKISGVADRMTRLEGTGAGKASVAAPIWGVVGSVLTAVLAGVILLFIKSN